jgi:hypothetical protein
MAIGMVFLMAKTMATAKKAGEISFLEKSSLVDKSLLLLFA